uniref:Lipase domain-containing protein n=1 Tax=Heliothis virescens TaxID=7102 RepID=A0A2A4IVM6_HELVI
MFSIAKCVVLLCAAVAASGFELGDMDVIFHLFTRTNPTLSQPLLPSINSIMASSFSPGRRTVITIHSHADTVSGNFNAFVVNAHLAAEDVNVLAIDWSPGSGMYTQGLGNAVQCGERIAQFINLLSTNFGYGPNNYRLVGVGLGGHIAGIAGDRSLGDIPHIIAIDPSLVGWTHHPEILKPDNAELVEVLHATAGHLGYDYPLGDLDFYPNGGSFQNSCGGDVNCSHILGYAFYAESVTAEGGSRFVGTACESYEQAITNACSGERDAVFGGLAAKSGQSGIYHFATNFQSPFAQG